MTAEVMFFCFDEASNGWKTRYDNDDGRGMIFLFRHCRKTQDDEDDGGGIVFLF